MLGNSENETFNPFNVGPPNYGRRLEIKIPTCPTYPPPVYAVIQPFTHAKTNSVSESSLCKPEKEKDLDPESNHIRKTRSKIGTVEISKAINKEMAASKQLATSNSGDERIDAGGISKTKMARTTDSHGSLKTILGTMSRRFQMSSKVRSNSKVSIDSRTSEISKSTLQSMRSTVSHLSAGATSVGSRVSGSSKKQVESSKSKETNHLNASQTTVDSRLTSKSKTSVPSRRQTPSQLSVAKSNVPSQASVMSQAMFVSDKPSSRQAASQCSVASTPGYSTSKVNTSRPIERVTSKASVKKTASAVTIKPSKKSVKSIKSIKSVKSVKNVTSREQMLNERAEKISEELKASEETSQKAKEQIAKTLEEQVADQQNRLKAGHENHFPRFDALIHSYSKTEPQRYCRDDRMSNYLMEAVLS